MKLSIIVAASENNIIGRNNDLPWHLPADMKYFKEKTLGHYILSGRKNYESIPERFRPLPDRINCVLSRDASYLAPNAKVFSSVQEAITEAEKAGETEFFIIGGGEIFKQCLSRVQRIYLTRVHAILEGDVLFPALNQADWNLSSCIRRPKDDKNPFDISFLVFDRI